MNQYNEELMSKYHTTTSRVIDVIEKYAGKDPALRKALTAEMRIFRNAEGDFGRVTAINDRETMLPGMSLIFICSWKLFLLLSQYVVILIYILSLLQMNGG